MPIVVVSGSARHVVVDGYKRVRCLQQLHRDTVAAIAWDMTEAEALIFRHVLHSEATDSALQQGWLLRSLHEDHRLSMEQLARRFDRSVSWVSRRLSLVRDLPEALQRHDDEGSRSAGRGESVRPQFTADAPNRRWVGDTTEFHVPHKCVIPGRGRSKRPPET